MADDDDKQSTSDAFQSFISGRKGKNIGNTKGLIVTWVVCLAVIFVILPLMIGMWSSGFVVFSFPEWLLAGILTAGVILAGVFIPPEKQESLEEEGKNDG